MKAIQILIIAVTLSTVGLACSQGTGSRAHALTQADLDSFISLEDAMALGQAEVPDGRVIGIELEVEDDDEIEPPAWEVSLFISQSNTIMEVEIDAVTGEILEVEVEDDADDDVEDES